MRRVLNPVDGPDCSLRAVRHVTAKRANYRDPDALEIRLVDVQPPFTSPINCDWSS